MSEIVYPGGQVMIQIDGAKIRQIREQKGLTQLYVATAVEVTTDTVSRWENKRYPSIKKENGIRLAQALEVDLSEIMESGNEPDIPDTESPPQTPDSQKENDEPLSITRSFSKKKVTLFLGIAALLTLVLLAVLDHLRPVAETQAPEITITRTIPAQFIPGRPLPVFIHISSPSGKSIPMILRENLPPGTSLYASSPETSNKHKNSRSIQWLKKIQGPTVFTYTLICEKNFEGSLQFEGMLKAGSGDGTEIIISGDSITHSSLFHWADRDHDNRISDEEILMVYDLTNDSDTSAIGIDMDLLEEMWLGDGYLWLPAEQKFKILE